MTLAFPKRSLALAAVLVAPIALAATGPSSSQSPYVVGSVPVVDATSVLTVGDAADDYRMVGLADGLGAFDNEDGTFTVVMNHELASSAGIIRAHGSKGAFVSSWIVDKLSLEVLAGADLMREVYLWDAGTQQSLGTPATFAFNRFCSSDLPPVAAFHDPATGHGTRERIYLHGEEGGSTGYQVATVATGPDAGKAYVLGKFNLSTNGSGLTGVGGWENALASPFAQEKTIVMGMNDGGTGIMSNSVAVYVGTKQVNGSEADRAGLNNGTLAFVSVAGNPVEVVNTTTRATNITDGTRFSLSGTSSTTFSRPEDGAWDPFHANWYWFVTTDRLDTVSDGVGAQIGQTRLWKLVFDDITQPALGGTIDLVIDGRVVDGQKVNMFDNMGISDTSGLIFIQEDPGNAAHNAKFWMYDPDTDELSIVVHHDPARFGNVGMAAMAPYTQDEEASGIIDISSILGPGTYLSTDQAHYQTGIVETVEGGQLQVLRIPFPVIGDDKNACKDGGWQGAFRPDGSAFRNQGDCIQFANTGR